jgi:hypothetical protein
MHEVGFEPTKHMHQILSLAPLTAREPMQVSTVGLEPTTTRLKVLRSTN